MIYALYTLDNLHPIDTLVGDTGVTVRLGTKWRDRLEPNTIISLQETIDGRSQIVGQGRVTEVWHGDFEDVPARLVELEHEASSRFYTGLFGSMKRAYGTAFDELSTVTVFSYTRIS